MKRSFVLALVLALSLCSCNLPAAATAPTPTIIPELPTSTPVEPTAAQVPSEVPQEPTASPVPEIVHKDLPGAPLGKVLQTVHDQVDENTAPQKQAFGGDDFRNGKYERPFDQKMNYLPEADLVSVFLSREDPLWVYILFKVNKPFTGQAGGSTHYMIEIDTDLDNRGNLLVITGTPKSTDWSTESVLVVTAPDFNIGGVTAVMPDETLNEGRGYYEEIFNNGKGSDPDLAWSRLSKEDPAIVQLAFKNTLTGGEKGKFIWLPWSDAGMLDWSLFEFNDHFTFTQAGYPLKEDTQNYPIKAVWGVDNTCRIPSNFTPMGYMPGICQNYDPAPSTGRRECPPCDPSRTKICPPCP